MWGVAPVYFKQLMVLPAAEILMHRVIWSVVLLVGLIAALKQWPKVGAAFRNKRVMQILFVAGLLLGANWLLFIWAINNDHILDASLGYYINPLINVFLGRLFLGERLRNLQRVAVGLAVVVVVVVGAICFRGFAEVGLPRRGRHFLCCFGCRGDSTICDMDAARVTDRSAACTRFGCDLCTTQPYLMDSARARRPLFERSTAA